jgi:Flp pilus assembly pilin Flp
MLATLINLLRNNDGATAVEFGLIGALLTVAAIGALRFITTGSF